MKYVDLHSICIFSALCIFGTVHAQLTFSTFEFTEIFTIGDGAGEDNILIENHEFSDIAVNSMNQIFIGGYFQMPVMAFSSEGRFIGYVGREGEGLGEFEDSGSLIIGPGDSIYVYDTTIDHLLVFEPEIFRYAYSMNTIDRYLFKRF